MTKVPEIKTGTEAVEATKKNPVLLGTAVNALIHRLLVLRENKSTPISSQQADEAERNARNRRNNS